MKKWKVTDYKTDDLEKLLAKIIRIAPAVYKLRTAIPANLRQMLVDGNQRDFRETVEREGPTAALGDKTYWPFWQGQDERLTIYSEELMYLLEKGHRLHEFKRKNGKPNQQMMVHPSQLAAVTAAYAAR